MYFSRDITINCPDLNVENFIARGIWKSKSHMGGYARPVLFISVFSTALGILVMLFSVFISSGFQSEIRNKVIGFGSHIQIIHFNAKTEKESDYVNINQDFYLNRRQLKGIKNMHIYANKPAILQSRTKDDRGNREVQGVLCKGISTDFDWDFLKQKMKSGRIMQFSKRPSEEIILSTFIANKMNVKVNDTLTCAFVSKKIDTTSVIDRFDSTRRISQPVEVIAPTLRKFVICGIYETGLEDFDNQFVFIDIRQIQEANRWGLEAYLKAEPASDGENIRITAQAFGGTGYYNKTINGKMLNENSFVVPPVNASYTYVLSDYKPEKPGKESSTVQDTFVLHLRVQGASADGTYNVVTTNEDHDYNFKTDGHQVFAKGKSTGGSHKYYTAGFEVVLNNWDDLQQADKILYGITNENFKTRTIMEQYSEIFNWLELLDLNVQIIIILMIIVAIINMVSALLVLILEKTRMIGILKTLGSNNISIRKIFLNISVRLMFRGLLIGNMLALVLFFIQYQFHVFTLDQKMYFVDVVPVEFNIWQFLLINIITVMACVLAVIIPTWLVSRILPVKAIRIN